MDNPNGTKYRVDTLQAFFLVSASLTIDIIQALLNLFVIGIFINRVITPFAWLFFLTWFYFLGIKFTKGGGKNMGVSLVSMIIEMIPYVDLLPGWTVATILLIVSSRREDKGKKPIKKKKGSEKRTNKKVSKKETTSRPKTEQNASVGSEIKVQEGSPKMDAAQKELNAVQTTGTKTAEEKTAETSPEKIEEKTNDSKKEDSEKKTERDRGEEGQAKEQKKDGDGQVDKKTELYDTRTNRYKNQQGQEDELAEFEDLPMQKEDKGTPILHETEGGLDKQEFSMGDIYREPIDITSKKSNPSQTKNKDSDDSFKMAA